MQTKVCASQNENEARRTPLRTLKLNTQSARAFVAREAHNVHARICVFVRGRMSLRVLHVRAFSNVTTVSQHVFVARYAATGT